MQLDNVEWYEGQHSITFVKNEILKNTWSDWGLIPSSRHSEPVNSIWSNKITVPGVNGEEDLVRLYPYRAVNSYELLKDAMQNDNPESVYEQYGYDLLLPTEGTLSFIIADQTKSFFVKQQEILAFLHNQDVAMIFTDNPSHPYYVRTSVDFSNGSSYSNVTISYSVVYGN